MTIPNRTFDLRKKSNSKYMTMSQAAMAASEMVSAFENLDDAYVKAGKSDEYFCEGLVVGFFVCGILQLGRWKEPAWGFRIHTVENEPASNKEFPSFEITFCDREQADSAIYLICTESESICKASLPDDIPDPRDVYMELWHVWIDRVNTIKEDGMPYEI